MTDIDNNSPAANAAPAPNASAIDDAALDQVVGGDATAPTTTKRSTVQDIHFTKTIDAASPNLFLI